MMQLATFSRDFFKEVEETTALRNTV